MQASQHFYDDGVAVGQDDDVGLLEFHAGGGHNHWHFQQFVVYELLDPSGNLVAPSTKMAWCLVPTDAIDLTVDGAVWHPGNTSLSSACGSASSQTLREVLLTGHGDTYNQFVSGQRIDITDVPNGDYRIRIAVNPADLFHETNTGNNEAFRDVTLGGTAGARTVVAAPVGDVTA